MKRMVISRLAKLFKDECGQTAVLLAVGMTAFIGLASTSIEAGHGYFAYRALVASTNAATLAAAQAMPNTVQASANATAYSSATGGKNATPLLTNVVVTTTFSCATTVTNSLNIPCQSASGGSTTWNGSYNTITVTQSAKVPSWFGGLFGITTFNLSYSSMAAMRGGTASNWNIAIILDTTKSMGDQDNGKQCSGTQEACAIQGVQALLEDLYPCALGETCSGGSGHYVDDVALYVFPPVQSSTAGKDYCSGSGTPSNGYYEVSTLPNGSNGSTVNNGNSEDWVYQVISYSNDYKTSDSASTLNTSSNIVKAVGYSGSGCSGIVAEGGAGTYYAQAIYQAQSDLAAQQAAHPGSRNAMIILSDGDATATVKTSSSGTFVYSSSTSKNRSGQETTTYTYITSTSDLQPSAANGLNGIPANNPDSYTYPSANGECGQAVVAAQAATTAGTLVYTIGYGSETSGCSSDATYSATVTGSGGGNWAPGDSPCQALAAMASATNDFFSDDGDGCKATDPSNANLTSLTAIFRQIASGLTTPRLIPNGTT